MMDFRLAKETAAPIAKKLAQQGTPFLLYTGQHQADLGLGAPHRYTVIEKPAAPRTILSAIAALVAG